MSVLAGLCPTQKLSQSLRTKAKPALLQALPTGTSSVQQNGCKLKRAMKSPLQDHNVQRVWGLDIFYQWLF